MDNGSEFISKEMDIWAYENNVIMDYLRPGKSKDNPFVDTFNGFFRDECLNANWFLTLDEVVEKIEAWRQEYNHFLPYKLLNDLTPAEFAKTITVDDKKEITAILPNTTKVNKQVGVKREMKEIKKLVILGLKSNHLKALKF